MKRLILFSVTSKLILISACVLPNNTNTNQKSESYEDKIKSIFFQKFRNKKDDPNENVSFSINTKLSNIKNDKSNVFTILSSECRLN